MIRALARRQILCLRFALLMVFFALSVFVLFVVLYRALQSGDWDVRGFDFVKDSVEMLFPYLLVLVILLDAVVSFSADYYQGTNLIYLTLGVPRRRYLLAKVLIAWIKYGLLLAVTSFLVFFLSLFFDSGLSRYLIDTSPQGFSLLLLRTTLGFWVMVRYPLILSIVALAAAELAQGKVFLSVFLGFAMWLFLLLFTRRPVHILFWGPILTLFHVGEMVPRVASLVLGEISYFVVCTAALVALLVYYQRKDIVWAVPVK